MHGAGEAGFSAVQRDGRRTAWMRGGEQVVQIARCEIDVELFIERSAQIEAGVGQGEIGIGDVDVVGGAVVFRVETAGDWNAAAAGSDDEFRVGGGQLG
jgi:hypothetical protein